MSSQEKIAHLANVSQSVVSRVLTGRAKSAGIAEETILRIQTIAKAVNYKPNRAASMLKGSQSKLVGVIVRSFEDQFLAPILKELHVRAVQSGFTLLVAGLEYGRHNLKEIELLPGYSPDGFIVIGTTDFSTWGDAFLNSGKPIIQIGLPSSDPRITSCGTDEAEVTSRLVQHLVELGHGQIAIIGDGTPASRIRGETIQATLRAAKLPVVVPFNYMSGAESTSAGADAARYYLQDEKRDRWPTAVIAVSDMIAMAFIRTLHDAGVGVPGFISVASFGDVEVSSLVSPSLTTVNQPAQQLAAAAMEMITKSLPLAPILLPGAVRVRESTAPARSVAKS